MKFIKAIISAMLTLTLLSGCGQNSATTSKSKFLEVSNNAQSINVEDWDIDLADLTADNMQWYVSNTGEYTFPEGNGSGFTSFTACAKFVKDNVPFVVVVEDSKEPCIFGLYRNIVESQDTPPFTFWDADIVLGGMPYPTYSSDTNIYTWQYYFDSSSSADETLFLDCIQKLNDNPVSITEADALNVIINNVTALAPNLPLRAITVDNIRWAMADDSNLVACVNINDKDTILSMQKKDVSEDKVIYHDCSVAAFLALEESTNSYTVHIASSYGGSAIVCEPTKTYNLSSKTDISSVEFANILSEFIADTEPVSPCVTDFTVDTVLKGVTELNNIKETDIDKIYYAEYSYEDYGANKDVKDMYIFLKEPYNSILYFDISTNDAEDWVYESDGTRRVDATYMDLKLMSSHELTVEEKEEYSYRYNFDDNMQYIVYETDMLRLVLGKDTLGNIYKPSTIGKDNPVQLKEIKYGEAKSKIDEFIKTEQNHRKHFPEWYGDLIEIPHYIYY